MRRRWAEVAVAGLLSAACARDGRGTEPPSDAAPVAATPEPETEPEPAPAPPADVASPEPTDEEFAWARRAPEQEAQLDAWDRANLQRLLRSFDELRCFHQAVRLEGERFMADAGREPEWFQHKQRTILALDEWLMRLSTENPRIFERSGLAGHILEAFELVAFTYLTAYTARDRTELDGSDAHWRTVETKVRDRATKLGGTLTTTPARCDPLANE